jgi:Mrp family chromosome partitioning ATPase
MNRNIRILQRQTAQASPFDTSTMPSLRENGGALPRRYRTSAEDEIAKLVQSVFILPDAASRPGAVAFCGVDAGTGCSWVCARAAAVLAEQVPGTVCVIDANLRSPSLHKHFGVEIEAGFAEAMKDPRPIRDFTPPTSTSNLRLMTASAGWKTPNGALKPARLRTRFSELRSEFDYLLIDPRSVLTGTPYSWASSRTESSWSSDRTRLGADRRGSPKRVLKPQKFPC